MIDMKVTGLGSIEKAADRVLAVVLSSQGKEVALVGSKPGLSSLKKALGKPAPAMDAVQAIEREFKRKL